jgi:hypothetical protein
MICSGYGFESTLLITSDPVTNQMFVGRSISVGVWTASGCNQVIGSGSGSRWEKLPTKIEKNSRVLKVLFRGRRLEHPLWRPRDK